MSTPKHGEEPKTPESVAADFLRCEISVTAVMTMTLRGLQMAKKDAKNEHGFRRLGDGDCM